MSERVRTGVIGFRLRVQLLAALMGAAGSTLAGRAGTAFADKGGCPDDSAVQGPWKANARSAHGVAKQLARGCRTTGEG